MLRVEHLLSGVECGWVRVCLGVGGDSEVRVPVVRLRHVSPPSLTRNRGTSLIRNRWFAAGDSATDGEGLLKKTTRV